MTNMEHLCKFMDEHPYVSLFMLWVICGSASGAIARIIRHLNIRKAGWPPDHCDADGDLKPTRITLTNQPNK